MRPRSEPAMVLHGLTILIVEDNEDARELLAHLLARSGATVHEAESSAGALAYLAVNTPDVLISDIAMPDEDGYSLMRRVRALTHDGKRRLPSVALTAFTSDEDRQRARQAGFDLHLPKPVDPERLVRSIAELSRSVDGPDGHGRC